MHIPALDKERLLATSQAGKQLCGKSPRGPGGQQDNHKPAVSWQQRQPPAKPPELYQQEQSQQIKCKDSQQCTRAQ